MAKVILLVRVSTIKQEIEAQKRELIELALADGYNEDDMVIIEGVGASAIKLNDVYMMEMEELYNTISGGHICAVYAWEISRIGRNEEVLMKFKNFLIDRKIQLIIKNPSLRLLNNDGSTNKGVELAFSLFATMSKQEMEVKKERFARAKARNKAEGKYNGGRIKLGYKLDKNNHFIINEERAEVVREIFNWYINGKSQMQIHKMVSDHGIWTAMDDFTTRGSRVGYIIRDRSYLGENGYPQIIDEDTFIKANEMIKNKKKVHRSKNVFFCKSILIDTLTGKRLLSRIGTLDYMLWCPENRIILNINAMDYIAKYCANQLIAWQLNNQAQTNRDEYEIKIGQNNALIETKEKQIKQYRAAIDRAIEMNIMHPTHFPTEKMNGIIKRNDMAIEGIEREIVDLRTENTRMKEWLSGKQTFINQIKAEYSEEKKKEIIDSVIERIEVTKVGLRHYMIDVKNKIGFNGQFKFEYVATGGTMKVMQLYADGRQMDITKTIRQNKRFERKRYEK